MYDLNYIQIILLISFVFNKKLWINLEILYFELFYITI